MVANVPAEGGDALMISWLAVLLPVLGVVLLDLSNHLRFYSSRYLGIAVYWKIARRL